MINDPTITATCDKCGCDTDGMEMCALANGGWDDRYMRRKLERMGWIVDGDKTICDDCAVAAEIGE